MNRLEEIRCKHDRLRALLAARGADAIWLRRPHNVSWMTAGADAALDITRETGAYSLLITPDKRSIITDNIELPRLRKEEHLDDFGFEFAVSNWYAHELPPMPNTLSDLDEAVEAAVQPLRWSLCESEQARLRALGTDAAAVLEAAVRAAQPGESEWQIAARLDAGCRERGGAAIVNLAAADDRIAQFRHPYATAKPLEKLLLLVLCMRRGGLTVSAARAAHFGAIPPDLSARQDRVAAVDAAGINATRAGRTLGDVFAALIAAYESQGEGEQWKNHHQGGIIGCRSRERIATPGDPTSIEVGQAFAWNPTIAGARSEDTILLGEDGFEIVTQASDDWSFVEVGIGGQTIRRPAIMER